MTSRQVNWWLWPMLTGVLLCAAGSVGAAGWDDPPPDSAHSEERRTRYRPPAPPVWYLGGGFSQASIDSDYDAIGRQSAGGFTVLGGVEFGRTWAGEIFISGGHMLATGATTDIFYPPDRAEYGLFVFSLRKGLWPLSERSWTPWLGLGYGFGTVAWETYYYNLIGFAPAFSGGVDVKPGKLPLVLRLQLLQHSAQMRDDYDHRPSRVTGLLSTAALVWRFGH